MISQSNTIVCLMGPTATGKTNLGIQLAELLPFEIISVDSALVYRGMDIGTAKPSLEILNAVPHHLINIRDPYEAYSAAQFKEDALKLIDDIFSRHKIPLLVGGTMLYFRALQQGLADMPSANPVLREQLHQEGLTQGWPKLHNRLKEIDPLSAQRIHPHDSQRIQRALEVFLLTGKNLTSWQTTSSALDNTFHFINIAIAPHDRSILHARIAKRFSTMLNQGLIEEVKILFNRGDLTLETPAIRSVGYRQVWEYLSGKYSFEEMREKGIIATRQLAKRQLTWLRSWSDIEWFDSEAIDLLFKVKVFLSNCKIFPLKFKE